MSVYWKLLLLLVIVAVWCPMPCDASPPPGLDNVGIAGYIERACHLKQDDWERLCRKLKGVQPKDIPDDQPQMLWDWIWVHDKDLRPVKGRRVLFVARVDSWLDRKIRLEMPYSMPSRGGGSDEYWRENGNGDYETWRRENRGSHFDRNRSRLLVWVSSASVKDMNCRPPTKAERERPYPPPIVVEHRNRTVRKEEATLDLSAAPTPVNWLRLRENEITEWEIYIGEGISKEAVTKAERYWYDHHPISMRPLVVVEGVINYANALEADGSPQQWNELHVVITDARIIGWAHGSATRLIPVEPDEKVTRAGRQIAFPEASKLAADQSTHPLLKSIEMEKGCLVSAAAFDEWPSSIPKHVWHGKFKVGVAACAVSPDGKILATVLSAGGSTWFWDMDSGKPIAKAAGLFGQYHLGYHARAVFSPCGRFFAVHEKDAHMFSREEIRIIDLTTGKNRMPRGNVWVLDGRQRVMRNHRAFTLGGSYYVVAVEEIPENFERERPRYYLVVRNLISDKGLDRIATDAEISVIALSPDNTKLAYIEYGKVLVRRLDGKRFGKIAMTFDAVVGEVADMVFSPDGRYLTIVGSKGVAAAEFDLTGKPANNEPKKFRAERSFDSVAYYREGLVVSSGAAYKTVYAGSSPVKLEQLEESETGVCPIVTPDGITLVTHRYGRTRKTALVKGAEPERVNLFETPACRN